MRVVMGGLTAHYDAGPVRSRVLSGRVIPITRPAARFVSPNFFASVK